jgi:hypothetical protein
VRLVEKNLLAYQYSTSCLFPSDVLLFSSPDDVVTKTLKELCHDDMAGCWKHSTSYHSILSLTFVCCDILFLHPHLPQVYKFLLQVSRGVVAL